MDGMYSASCVYVYVCMYVMYVCMYVLESRSGKSFVLTSDSPRKIPQDLQRKRAGLKNIA